MREIVNAIFTCCAAVLSAAKIITCIAMFYDLEGPVNFAREIESVLAPGGVWHFEQSYLPSMLRTVSYDTVCHEHLEYCKRRGDDIWSVTVGL